MTDNTERIKQIEQRLTPPYPGNFYVLPEWEELIIKLDDDLSALDPDYTLSQVKEKFGGLRYYFTASEGTDHDTYCTMRNLVHAAEQGSFALLKG